MNQPNKVTPKRVALFLLVLFFLIGTFSYFRLNRFYDNVSTRKEIFGIPINAQTVYSLLVLGYGGAGHEGSYLTDTMMVVRVDTETKKVLIISLPRDIWVKVPTKNNSEENFHAKINSVYQMGLFSKNYPGIDRKYSSDQGAAELVKFVVEAIVGFKVDYYLALDFEGFRQAVDTLGGVDLTVDHSFTDPEYPVTGLEDDPCGLEGASLEAALLVATSEPVLAFPCRYETLHFDAGRTHMDGTTALKYVRSRHAPEDGGDFGRANRQQNFLEAMRDKVLAIGFIPKILPLLNDLESHVRLDIPKALFNKFLGEADNISEYEVGQLVLTTDNYLKESHSDDGQYILIPKAGIGRWGEINKVIEMVIAGISPTPLPSPTKKKK